MIFLKQSIVLALLANFAVLSLSAGEMQKGELIPVPEGFSFKPDFKVYRGNGKPLGAVTSFAPKTKANIGADNVLYVDITKGDDTNSGKEKDKPLKSLWRALTKKGAKKIVISPGRYDYENGWRGFKANNPVTLVADGESPIVTTHLPVEFKPVADHAYQAVKQLKERWGNVVDLSRPEKERVLKQVKQLPLDPGQYYVDGDNLYVRTFDDRQPNDKILCLLAAKNAFVSSDCYIENVEFWGGYNCFKALVPEGKTVTLNRVTGKYCHGGPGFQFNLAGHATMYHCRGYNNYSDDFNWHNFGDKGGTAVEINNLSRFAGQNHDFTSINASTIHGTIRIIRINGDYRFARNRVVADVGKSQSWNIACISSGSWHTDPKTPWWSQNWNFAQDTEAWIDTCVGSNVNDTSKRGWSSEKNARLHFHNTDFSSGDVKFNKKPTEY